MKFKNQRGASAVEFAIVLFPLLLLVFGIIDFGFLFYNKAMLTNASREGARAGIVSQSPRVLDSKIRDIVNDSLEDIITHESLLIPPPPIVPIDDITITITYLTDPPPPSPQFGDLLTVTVNYTYNYFFLSIIGISSKPLQGQTTMKYE